jgi:hypothetical protein
MTTITAKKGKVRSENGRIDSNAGLGLTDDTFIHSPRYIANGSGAWSGTLGELISNTRNYTTERFSDIEDRLVERGVLPPHGFEDENGNYEYNPEYGSVTIDDVLGHLTYEDISDMLDDPNVVITDGAMDAKDAEIAGWELTHHPLSTKSCPAYNH